MATGGDATVQTENLRRCSNCKRDIPASNFVMHEQHCLRNIELCRQCGEPVVKTQKDEHMEEFHVEVACKCGKKMEKRFLETHQAAECRERMVTCEYCELELTFEKLAEHVDYCGSRTEKCEKCGRFVQKARQSFHDATNCETLLDEEKTEPRRTVVVDVEIAPQRRVTSKRRSGRERRQGPDSEHTPSLHQDRGRSDLEPHVQPDSTLLPANVRMSREPAVVTQASGPTDDSDYAWQVAQDINGLALYPDKVKAHHSAFNADEPPVSRGIESTQHRAPPRSMEPTLSIGQPSRSKLPRPSPEPSLQRGLVVGQSFVVPEGENLDEILADQLAWDKAYGVNDRHTTMPEVEEGPTSSVYSSRKNRQLETDRELAERLQQESSLPITSLGLSDYEQQQQEDAMRRIEREREEKREEERMAAEERRRKQMEEDEAMAKQIQEQLDRESSQLMFDASDFSRMGHLGSSIRADERRREERRQQEDEERRQRRQMEEDERLARNMEFEWQDDGRGLSFGLSDSDVSGSSLSFARNRRRQEFPPREGFRYRSEGIDMGGREESSRRSGLVDDEIRSTTPTGELGLTTCRHCDELLLPSDAVPHELTCSMRQSSLRTVGSHDSHSLVRGSSLPVQEKMRQPQQRESPFGVDHVVSRTPASRPVSREKEKSPCLYCSKPYPLAVLTQHQLQCPANRNNSAIQLGRSMALSKPAGHSCSYCHKKDFTLDEFLEHERWCPKWPNKRSTSTSTSRRWSHDKEPQPQRISCIYCNQSVSARGRLEHERECPKNPQNEVSSMPTTSSRNGMLEVVGLQAARPCQYCRKPLKLAEVRQHQIECEKNICLSEQLRKDLMRDGRSTHSTTRTRSSVSSRDALDVASVPRTSAHGITDSGASRVRRSSALDTKQDPSRLTNKILHSSIGRTNCFGLLESTRPGQDRDLPSTSRSPLSFGTRQTSFDASIPKRTQLSSGSQSLSGHHSLRRSGSLTSLPTASQQHGSTALCSRPVSPPVGTRARRDDKTTSSAIANKYSAPLAGRRDPKRHAHASAKPPWHS